MSLPSPEEIAEAIDLDCLHGDTESRERYPCLLCEEIRRAIVAAIRADRQRHARQPVEITGLHSVSVALPIAAAPLNATLLCAFCDRPAAGISKSPLRDRAAAYCAACLAAERAEVHATTPPRRVDDVEVGGGEEDGR